MSYIDNNLLPGEKILFRTKKHFIIFFMPAVFVALAFFLTLNFKIPDTINGTLNQISHQVPFLNQVPHLAAVFMLLLAAYSGILKGITYLSSDYVVTNTRVIMRQGFFDRYVCDMRLNTVANVSVDQNLIAQALNYGSVAINGFGGATDYFYEIANPVALQKAVNSQLDARNR
jgi:uncharacterized membrane protein YdbT with pleckstrin-like domain